MIEVLSHPITLLCLGVIFILCALLFFYFKRSMMVIEHAQMEQASVLRNFIATMEMNKHDYISSMNGEKQVGEVGGGISSNRRSAQDSSLIDVSDNETTSNRQIAYSDDNAYETESNTSDSSSDSSSSDYESDSNSEYSTTIEENVGSDIHTIKVINVEDLEDLNKTYSENRSLQVPENGSVEEINHIDDSASTSCDDIFSTDLDKMELDKMSVSGNEISEMDMSMSQLTKTSFIQSHENETIKQFDQMTILLSHEDFKGYTVSQIRDYAIHRNIINKGDKMKKKELVDYVIESNIEGGAENLKVNKVGSLYNVDDMDNVDDIDDVATPKETEASIMIQETVISNSLNISLDPLDSLEHVDNVHVSPRDLSEDLIVEQEHYIN